MGAVATIFPTLTGTWALPKHVFITQTRETELRLSHDLGSLCGGLFLKDTALPPPQPPMQPPRPPTPVMAPTNSIFVPNVSTNPQVNQFLGPKSSSVPGQLHMSMPHVQQQQNLTQSHIPHQTQVPIAHSPHKVPPPLNPRVNSPLMFPSQHLFIPQPPVIPSPPPASTATYLPVPNIPQHSSAWHLDCKLHGT